MFTDMFNISSDYFIVRQKLKIIININYNKTKLIKLYKYYIKFKQKMNIIVL
jgi:hypothetical protein